MKIVSQGMPLKLAVGHSESGGELVQSWVPGARVVKALNIVGAHIMVDPPGRRAVSLLSVASRPAR